MVLLEALASCLPLTIISTSLLIIVWKARGRIESFKISDQGLEIQFGKSCKRR